MAHFIGEYHHSLDSKGRVIVPSKWRESISIDLDGKGFFMTPGFDRCIFVYTPAAWKEMEEKVRRISIAHPSGRKFQRLFLARARYSDCDAQGRMSIDASLREVAGIRKNVVLVGLSNRFEVWDEDRWMEYARDDGDLDALALELLREEDVRF